MYLEEHQSSSEYEDSDDDSCSTDDEGSTNSDMVQECEENDLGFDGEEIEDIVDVSLRINIEARCNPASTLNGMFFVEESDSENYVDGDVVMDWGSDDDGDSCDDERRD
jgi:hypothetical protein